MGYSLCKILSLGQSFKLPKTCQNRFCIHIGVILCKNRSKKHQIFQKWDDVENRPSCKVYSLCMGYSLCKILNLGKNLRLPKTCQNLFSIRIGVILCQKTLKKHQIFQKWDDVENRPSCKVYSLSMGYSLCKILNLAQNFKLPKICQNRFCNSIGVILCKKPLHKIPNIPDMRRWWKSAILQSL